MNEFYQPEVSILSLIRFICLNHPPMRKWELRTLAHWILFHREEGFLIPVSSDGLTLDALVIARPIMDVLDSYDHYKFDQEGHTLYIELAISKTPKGLRALTIAVIHRFGRRQSVCWHRRNVNKLVVLPASRVVSRILKKEPA